MSAPFGFSVDEAQSQRFAVAIQLLREGRTITYRGITIALCEPQLLDCGVITQWSPANISEDIARSEIVVGKEVIHTLDAESASFAHLVAGRHIRFSLISWEGMNYGEVYRLEDEV